MKIVILVLYILFLTNGSADTVINEEESDVIKDELVSHNVITGTLYRTVKKYFCSVQKSYASELILYDTREWSFPAQDVTLNLDYPAKNNSNSIQYLLTEVLVIVQLQGSRSEAFITSGGMMRDHISMKFIFSDISRLSYQFYLYGFPKQQLRKTENFANVYNIC